MHISRNLCALQRTEAYAVAHVLWPDVGGVYLNNFGCHVFSSRRYIV